MKLRGIFYMLLISIISSCTSTKSTNTRDARDIQNPSELSTTYLDLADYLKRVPGVTVNQRGSSYTVMVRGMSSMSGPNEPLYVIDRAQYSTYADAAAAIDPNDIGRVQVLKDVASTSQYGMRGANGVILIYSKK
jgi:TonB-dependent SusC/RagA subfamily outer membrane receptor